ncbi:MAG: hypothetical protein ACM3WV_07910 [Bacillota bacterium]
MKESPKDSKSARIIHMEKLGRICIPLHLVKRASYYEFFIDEDAASMMLVPIEITLDKKCIFCGQETDRVHELVNQYICEKCENEQKNPSER